MSRWQLAPALPVAAREAFADLTRVFALEGERVASDQVSEVLRVRVAGLEYYVKRYWAAGKGLRRWLGTPRIQAEWRNLQRFARWGIASAPIAACGLERRRGLFVRGAMITCALVGTRDLAAMASLAAPSRRDPRLKDPRWVHGVSAQIARATRCLHDHYFTHNDLKWRNLLVDEAGKVYLIDCPSGSFWWGPLLQRRIVKDLACLDKVGKYVLSRSQRLRFYLQYRERSRLLAADKRCIRQIVGYFEGRE